MLPATEIFNSVADFISYAQKIIRIPKFTQIPNVPLFIEGIFNLRGKVIPIFDLKKYLELIKQREELIVDY